MASYVNNYVMKSKKKNFGLLGQSLAHSVSPLLHANLGDYSYELIEREENEVEELFKNPSYRGFNVTIPYKKLAYELCDKVSETASKVGCVNTVVFNESGVSFGYNTDVFGFEYLCKRSQIDVSGKKCLVLGSGGGSAAVCLALEHMKASSVEVCSRSGKLNYVNLYKRKGDFDILINTTPVGMYPDIDASPVELNKLAPLQAVIDIIYNPDQTKLTMQAKLLGIKSTTGLSMLIGQGYLSSLIFKKIRG